MSTLCVMCGPVRTGQIDLDVLAHRPVHLVSGHAVYVPGVQVDRVHRFAFVRMCSRGCQDNGC